MHSYTRSYGSPLLSLRRFYRRWFAVGHAAQLIAAFFCMLSPLGAQYQPNGSGYPFWNSSQPEPPEGPDYNDFDMDLLQAWHEDYLGTNPWNPDTDGDLITDRDEVYLTHTNPTDYDSNDNGKSDLTDYLQTNHPWDEYDGDGFVNYLDPYPADPNNYSSINSVAWYGDVFGDVDGDGMPNWSDTVPYTAPDADVDGIPDTTDPFPNDYNNYSALNGIYWYGDVSGDYDMDGMLNWQDSTPYPTPDSDSDGILDSEDPFPSDYNNYSYYNTISWYGNVLGDADGDGTANWCDYHPYPVSPDDVDDDTLANWEDPYPYDFGNYSPVNEIYWYGAVLQDNDGDTIQNWRDPYPYDQGNFCSLNNTSWGQNILGDDDADGVPNWQDEDPSPYIDQDGDGILNGQDPFPTDPTNTSWINGIAWYELVLMDDDADGVPNWQDEDPSPYIDQDGDGILNGQDPFPTDATNLSWINGIVWYGSVLMDDDADGVPNWEDAWPSDPYNGVPPDSDGDGLTLPEENFLGTSDWDVDSDHDGLSDFEEVRVFTNYPGLSPTNTNSLSPHYSDWHMVDMTDTDGGGIPDRIEMYYGMNWRAGGEFDDVYGDLDGDGVSNLEAYGYGWNLLANYARDYDRDNDGMTNIWEMAYGLNPNDAADAYDDADADFLFNVEESYANLNPTLADTDGNPSNGDDFNFLFEIPSAPLALNRNDLESDSRQYNDDWDGDGTPNMEEVYAGTDPREPSSHPGAPTAPDDPAPGVLPILTGADPWEAGGPSGGVPPDESFTDYYVPEPVQPPSKDMPPLIVLASWSGSKTYEPYEFDSAGQNMYYLTPENQDDSGGPVEQRSVAAINYEWEGVEYPPTPSQQGYHCNTWLTWGYECDGVTCECTENGALCDCYPDTPETLGRGARRTQHRSASISATYPSGVTHGMEFIWQKDYYDYDGTTTTLRYTDYETIAIDAGGTNGGTFSVTAGSNEMVVYSLFSVRALEDDEIPPPGPRATLIASAADSAGPKFRRVGMDGKPMRDSFPDPQDEYKQPQTATYVDAYNATLHHSMTDASARPSPGTHLALAVRRDYAEETWTNQSGLRFNERPDRPFGAGFVSNICAGVTVERLDRPYKSPDPEVFLSVSRFTATVVDEQGAVQRFKWNKMYQTWIHSKEERLDVITSRNKLTCLWDEFGNPHSFVLEKFNGGRCVYENTSLVQSFPSNRLQHKESLVTMRYARMVEAKDRRGQKFTYAYSAPHSLIAATITSDIGGAIVQVKVGANGLVQSVASTTDAPTTFTYSSVSAGGVAVPVLATSTKEQRVTSYSFATWNEVDPTPLPPGITDMPPDTIYHVYLTGATEPGGRVYAVNSVPDQNHTYEQTYSDSNGNVYLMERKQIGRPRRVTSVSGPAGTGATFVCYLASKVDVYGSLSITAYTQVTGTAGSYSFGFGTPMRQYVPPDIDELWDLNHAVLAVCSFQSMSIYSSLGNMTFRFDPYNGSNLTHFQDCSGHSTVWDYDFGKEMPKSQINVMNDQRFFTYDTKDDLLTVKDERGVKKEFIRHATTGLPLWVNVYDTNNQPVFQRQVLYESAPKRTTFARREVVRALHPELGETDIVYDVERDNHGNVTREIVDPSGLAIETRHDYSDRDLLVRTIDPRGYTTRHAYDIHGNRIRTVHPDGSDRVWEFDGLDNLTMEKDEEGGVTLHEYDTLDRRIKTTVDLNGNDHADGRQTDLVTEWTYALDYKVLTETDPRGVVTTHSYDGARRRTSSTKGGLETKYGYAGYNTLRTLWDDPKPIVVTDPRGATVTTTYDYLQRATAVARSQGGTTYSTYDKVGNPTSVTDVLGKTTTTTYDAMARPVSVLLPDGRTQTTAYNSQGKPLKVVDVVGHVTRTHYDNAGRPITVEMPEVSVPGGGVACPTVRNTYDRAGNIVAVTDALGLVSETVYDNRNRAVQAIASPTYDATTGTLRRATMTTEFDRLGREVSVTDAFGQQTTKVYDRASRLLETHLPPVSVNGGAAQALMTRSVYDANGNVVEAWDTAQHCTVNVYDANNRLTKSTDPANQATEFGYDGAGNRTSVKDAKGNITTWTYDHLNRMLQEQTPSGVIVTNQYNALNKTRTQDARGQVLTYEYDLRHRLTTMKMYPNASPSTPPSNVRSYTHDYAGNITGVTETADPTVNVTYTYDAQGHVLSETSRGVEHEYEYDLAGNRVKSTYGTGRVVLHAYDAVHRLISLTEDGRVTQWEYDVGGRCVALAQGNGLVQRQSYDAQGRLMQRSLYQDDVQTPLTSVSLAYDASGNVMRQEERWSPATGMAPSGGNRTTEMAYDAASRLTGEKAINHGDGSAVQTTYAYDSVGNRSTKTVVGGEEAGVSTYAYNPLNQLTGFIERAPDNSVRRSVSFTYDVNGNRTSRVVGGTVTHAYAWDWNNRLTQVEMSGGAVHRYNYDYLMRRTGRDEAGTATAITYSGGVSVAEYAVSGLTGAVANPAVREVEYQRGPDLGGGIGGLLYSLRGGDVKFNVANGRGDVVAQSDASGMLTWTASYEAFGKRPVEVGSNADRQRANTKEEDPTGLLYEGYRYRDIETGTWLSRDPSGFVDGPNLYAYCVQNPWTKFDPDGQFWSIAITVGFAAFDTYRYATGKMSGAEYARSMVVNGACLAADVVTAGNGGGMVVRAAALSCKAKTAIVATARAIERVDNAVSAVESAVGAAEALKEGNVGAALVQAGSAVLAGKAAGQKADVGKFCFAAGTGVWRAEGMSSIEDLKPGQRVLTGEGDDVSTTQVTEGGWQQVEFAFPDPFGSGQECRVVLLRPEWYIAQGAWRVGSEVTVDFGEEVSAPGGAARIVSMTPASKPEDTAGRVITGTFQTWTSDLCELWMEGLETPILVTGGHRFFSESRDAWTAAHLLQLGETIRSLDGSGRRVEAVHRVPGLHRVYNIEVEHAHCYHVSTAALLTHNNGDCTRQQQAAGEAGEAAGKAERNGPKPLNSPDPAKWEQKGGTVDENWTYTDWEGNVVPYTNGYPDFAAGGHVKASVEIDQKGNYTSDYKDATDANGGTKPDNTTWHHHENGKTMEAVDSKIHHRFRHRGGVAEKKRENKK
jgi:RHS repeat-associated protein